MTCIFTVNIAIGYHEEEKLFFNKKDAEDYLKSCFMKYLVQVIDQPHSYGKFKDNYFRLDTMDTTIEGILEKVEVN